MTSSVSKMSESKLKLKDAEGDPLKQLELLESSTCYPAIRVFSLYNELEMVGELQMRQHAKHISMHGHIKDFTTNKEGKVITIDKLLAGCIPKDTSTALLPGPMISSQGGRIAIPSTWGRSDHGDPG